MSAEASQSESASSIVKDLWREADELSAKLKTYQLENSYMDVTIAHEQYHPIYAKKLVDKLQAKVNEIPDSYDTEFVQSLNEASEKSKEAFKTWILKNTKHSVEYAIRLGLPTHSQRKMSETQETHKTR
jgi:hypothetical protein